MPLNPNEAPEGYIACQGDQEKGETDCEKCDLRSTNECCDAVCHRRSRSDGRHVYFIKKPQEKPMSVVMQCAIGVLDQMAAMFTSSKKPQEKPMTKQEAMDQIKKLQEYVATIPGNNHPEYKRGQVYRHKDGGLYMLVMTRFSTNKQIAAKLDGCTAGCIWSFREFGEDDADKNEFTYVGMFDEVFKPRKA